MKNTESVESTLLKCGIWLAGAMLLLVCFIANPMLDKSSMQIFLIALLFVNAILGIVGMFYLLKWLLFIIMNYFEKS